MCPGATAIGGAAAYEFTWAFALRDEPDERTHLLVRERYAYTRPWAWLLVEPVEAVSFVMGQKMLGGISGRTDRWGVCCSGRRASRAAIASKDASVQPHRVAARAQREPIEV